MRAWRRGVLAAVLVATSGCGAAGVPASEPTPYDGPLQVPPAVGVDRWDDPGAAGRVIDCDVPDAVVGGTSTDPFSGGEVGATATAALQKAHDEGTWDGLDEMRVVREEADRVLYAYAAAGRTRQAVIVRYGPAVEGTGAGPDGLAWYVESWGRCDIAEYPAAVAERAGWQVLTDAGGRRLPTATVAARKGGRDCLPGLEFLDVDRFADEEGRARTYVAHGNDYPSYFDEPFRIGVELPADAVDTGWRLGERRVWLSPDGKRAYVGDVGALELWPLTVSVLGCA